MIDELAQRRLAKTPHLEGKARCLACRHEWHALVPAGTVDLECPNCSLMKGALIFKAEPAKGDVWQCACGNDLFLVLRTCIFCPQCGLRTSR